MAARLSHSLLGAVNLVTLLLSLPVVCTGVYFRMRAVTDCDRTLQLPVIALGCAVLLLSLVGLVGACGRRAATRPFLWAYVAAVFLLTAAVFALTLFAFVVTYRGGGAAGGSGGSNEYRLCDFSGWMQARIAAPETWRRVESCLAEARVCGGRFDGGGDVGPLAMDFYRRHLSPIQSGCCKPPTRCGFRFVNATFWEAAGSGGTSAAASDGDCRAWSNDPRVLCFECDACKAGVLATVNRKWKAVAVFNVALLVVLVVVYMLGCCALRSNGGKQYQHNGRGAEQT